MEEDVATFIALGCDGALAKPIDSEALYAVLSRHLPSAHAAAPAAVARHEATPVSDAAPDPVPDPMAAAMAQIRRRFVERIPAERAALAAALDAARSSGDGDALRQIAHRLKGSAGTLGFNRIGAAAAALDRAARTPSANVDDATAALDRQLADLHSPLDDARPEDAPR
jgi:HPt (histidine-containing phosphotransfer) domain-containing protein